MECDDRVAAGGVDERDSRFGCAFGVGNPVNPCEAVARVVDIRKSCGLLDSEV